MSYAASRKINPSALRAYDIRGGIGELMQADDAYYIGRAIATKIIKKYNIMNPVVAVGRDGRLSSPEIFKHLSNGLAASGAIVKDIGVGPSPMLYFATRSQKFNGGVMITGSHNPPHHNGFKMMYGKEPLFADEIQEIGVLCEKGDFADNAGGKIEKLEIKSAYIEAMLNAIEAKAGENLKNMSIAWDPGNGAAGEVNKEITQKLAGKHFIINEVIDGNFPAHHPDPTEEKNLEQLKELVRKNNCDLGIAFDGDGDRIGAIDGKGRVIWGDQMMGIFAEDILEEKPGSTIIVDVKASETFFDQVRALGGNPVMWKTGHSFIKNKLAETGAPLAGEMSGHIFFADKYFGFDDALYAAMRLINFFAKKGMKPSAKVDSFIKAYASQEYRITVPEEKKVAIVEGIRAKVKATGKPVFEIDGIRVKEAEFGGWWLLRSSNTQAAISIRAESTSEAGLQKIKDLINTYLVEFGVTKIA